MKKIVTTLLASGALLLCCSANALYGQVPIEVSPEHASYETLKKQWISENPTAYQQLQNTQDQGKVVKNAPVVSDGAAYEAEKMRGIKAAAQTNSRPATTRKAPVKFTPNTGIVSESQIESAGGDYDAAKVKWVKENPETYRQLSQPKGKR